MSDIDDRHLLCDKPLRFDGFGYFARPIAATTVTALTPAQLGRWLELQAIIERAKRGELGGAPRLLELYREHHADPYHPSDGAFGRSAITVLAHIGSPDQFKAMRAEIERPEIHAADPNARDLIFEYCRAFHLWARLDALPVLLDQYLGARMRGLGETEILPVYMSNMLDPVDAATMITEQPPSDLLEDYLNLVMNRHDALVAELGSDRVHVAFGEPLSVQTLARRITQADDRFTLTWLRARFEPMTGIDCSGFFTVAPWTPLAAAAIAEDFLASGVGERFEDGARYFFGHRIPD